MEPDEEFPPACPRCGSRDVEIESNHEYTGGGYADTWYEFYCNNCKEIWSSEKSSGYM